MTFPHHSHHSHAITHKTHTHAHASKHCVVPASLCACCVAVVLFELLLGNNWHVLMDGFKAATGNFAVRVYFIVFILISEVCGCRCIC